jgi:IclR family acetate operon transcriptional repressor
MAVARLSTVEKALRVLDAIADSQPITGSALARELGLDKNAVQRILITLGYRGWLQQDRQAGGWRLGPQSLVVGGRYAGALRERAHPVLRELATESGETVTLWAVEGDAFTVVDAVESTQTLRGALPIGFAAKVVEGGDFLAFYDRAGREELLAAAGLDPMPDERVRATRERGYYVIDTSFTATVAVGAPVWDGGPSPIAALLLVAPTDRLVGAALEAAGARIRDAAVGLSTRDNSAAR